jgi:corrinoid protein of di/trimethylamine methyltransferase
MMMQSTILEQLSDAVMKFDDDKVQELCEKALAEGYDPIDLITNGLIPGMDMVGDLFEKGEYFLPELLLGGEAFNSGFRVLKPQIVGEGLVRKGTVVLGTVQGDMHDIGKNLVKLMLESGGYTVHDLGKDVPVEKFVEVQARTNAELVAMSSLITGTLPPMRDAIRALKQKEPNVAIIVGGASVNAEIAEQFGADGYAETAVGGVKVANELVSKVKEARQSA